MTSIKIGIIGGTGLEDPQFFTETEAKLPETPYGKPSSKIKSGLIEGIPLAILSRHGVSHTIPPTQVNNRANIFALKEMGCTHILATTACGSLRDHIERGDVVFPDQFIDFTRRRELSFFDSFEEGDMKHAPMADPFDTALRSVLIDTAKEMGIRHHERATVITIEGPRFSTRAESEMFRQWGADVINMSTAPEAILAIEAGIPYGLIAMSTDYDCWKTDEDPVSWEAVMHIFKKNLHNVVRLILLSIKRLNV